MVFYHSPTRPISAGFSLRSINKYALGSLAILTLAVITSLFSSSLLYAQLGTNIVGTLVDPSGNPVAGANISLSPGEILLQSDQNGSFEAIGLTDGRYLLTISCLGYASREYGPIRVRSGEVARIRVELTPAAVTIPETEIHHFRQVHPALAQSTAVITRDLWQASGARDLADALRQTPGVTVLEGGRYSRITLRGSPSHTVLIDLDGVPLQDVSTGEADLSSIRLDQLSAIGVEQSGAGGKVHLISSDIRDNDPNGRFLETAIEAYSAHGYKVDAASRHSLYGTGLEVSFGGTSEQGDHSYTLDDGSINQRINNDSETISGQLRFRRTVNRINLTGGYYFDRLTRGIPNLLNEVPTPDASLKGSRSTFRLGAETSLPSGGIEFLAYHQAYSGNYNNPEYQTHPETGTQLHFIPEETEQEGSRFGMTGQYFGHFKHGDFHLAANRVEDRFLGKDILNNRVAVGVGYGTAKRITLETEAQLRLSQKLNGWTLALIPAVTFSRIDDVNGRNYQHGLPSLSGSVERSWGWGSGLIGFRYSRSVVIPAFNALLISENYYAVGNRNLKPERGESFEVNAEFSAQNQLGKVKASLTPFNRHIDDLIVWQRNSFSKYYPDNIARTFARGIESSLSISIVDDNIELLNSYIYNVSTIETPGDVNRGNFTPHNPMHSASVTILKRPKPWGIALGGRWVSRRYSTMSNWDPISTAGMGLPPYALYDLSVDYKRQFKSWNLLGTWGLDNILNARYRIIERSPMPGRSTYLRITLEVK